MRTLLFWLLLLFALPVYHGCVKDPGVTGYKTRKVLLVSVDGPRWSETWGDSTRQYIPYRDQLLLPQGVLLTSFTNEGPTYTNAGHTAMLSGFYQTISNNGSEIPQMPNIFQHWLKSTGLPQEKAWFVSSKDKVNVLIDCQDVKWAGRYLPKTLCGVNGPGSGYCDDTTTLRRALEVMQQHHPTLMMVHFKEPDAGGHSTIWNNYITGITSTDRYVAQLWNYLQSDPYYAGVTTMFVTNDHGRHLDTVANGFPSHGDNCAGCRHIELLAIGPDFKQNKELAVPYQLKDVPVTIGELLGFRMKHADGTVMHALFK